MSAQRRTSRAAAPAVSPQLSTQDIVDVALQLIRKSGADKLSMRSLAAQLGVTPMAIYYHVPNKEALLDLVIDAVLSSVPMPAPDPQRWEAQMKAYVVVSRQLIGAYPGLSRVIVERSANSKAARALFHYAVSVLLAAGFDEREAALAIATYNTYLYGVYAAMSARRSPGARTRSRGQGLGGDAAREGRVGEVIRHLRAMRVEDTIEYGIDAVIEGIAARAKRRRAPRPASARR